MSVLLAAIGQLFFLAASKLVPHQTTNSTNCQDGGYFASSLLQRTNFGLQQTQKVEESLLCAPTCLECNTDGTCTSCYERFTLNTSTETCERCTANCWSCDTNGAGSCDMCEHGYTLNITTETCEACAANCSSCNINGPGLCDQCFPGLSLSIDNTTCSICALGCKSCAINGEGKCDECYSGGEGPDPYFQTFAFIGHQHPAYVLSEDNTTCMECGQHCLNCNKSGAGLCDVCGNAYMEHDISLWFPIQTNLNEASRTCEHDFRSAAKARSSSSLTGTAVVVASPAVSSSTAVGGLFGQSSSVARSSSEPFPSRRDNSFP